MTLQIGWNLEKALGSGMCLSAQKAEWQSVKFDNYSITFIPKSRGVYIVSVSSNMFGRAEPFSLFHTPAYIGMSLDLRKRFDAHTASSHHDALWRRLGKSKLFCMFWYAVFEDKSKSDLKKIEQNLIDIYGSPLNRINSVKTGSTLVGTVT